MYMTYIVDALWIMQSSFSLFGTKLTRNQQKKIPNIFDDFSVLSVLFTENARKSVLVLNYGQKWTSRIPNNKF